MPFPSSHKPPVVIQQRLANYPPDIREKFLIIRSTIIEVAAGHEDIGTVSEDLKWNEPSFISRNGSTIRMDWKAQDPKALYLYFHCKTRLIDTFKQLYPQNFHYIGNRAIRLEQIPEPTLKPLKHCIYMALLYHRLKHLPMLGQ